MALNITQNARSRSQQTIVEPSLVVEIDGVSTLYGAVIIKKYARIGDENLLIGNDWVIGGYDQVEDQSDLISLDGSTTSISQQLLQDKGGTGSVSSMQIALIDKDQEATRLITPGVIVTDLLGRKVRVWLSFNDTAFPEDYSVIFQGIIDEITADSKITINVSSPEQKKRQQLFTKIQTSVVSLITIGPTNNAIDFREWNTGGGGSWTGEVTATIPSGTYTIEELVDAVEVAMEAVSPLSLNYSVSSNNDSRITRISISHQVELRFGSGAHTGTTSAAPTLGYPETDHEITNSGGDTFYDGGTAVGGLNTTDTTIKLDSVEGLLLPADSGTLRTYVRIDDEIIQYAAIDTVNNEITGCTRAQFGTIAVVHDHAAEVDSFYRLTGSGIELALKVMMSGVDGPWVSGLAVDSFVRINPTTDVTNAVFFGSDIRVKHGVAIGDKITVTGATESANNVTSAVISSMVAFEDGLALILSGAGLVIETGTTAVASFQSQYDVLGHGVSMGGDEVDIEGFQRVADFFAANIPDYDFYIKDSVVAKDFIDTEILFPAACYSIPRKGRVSLGFTSPPVAIEEIPALTSREVTSPNKVQIKRSIGKFYYNAIVYRFDEDAVEEKFLAGRVTLDSDSQSRIPLGVKPMTITSKGLRNDNDTVALIDQNALRILERYKFAAESIKATVQYGVGYPIEVGDVVLYGDEDLLLPDTKYGTRSFRPRLMEVFNKSLNIKTGEVSLDLVDTNYLTNGRYGIFSPASVLDSGSTTTTLVVTDSFGLAEFKIEADKWRPYIGQKILIHDQNWTYQYESVLRGISNANPYQFTIDAIAAPPAAGDILDLIQYPDSVEPSEAQLLKTLHCFMTPRIDVATGVSGTQFTVASGEESKFFVGATVLVHSADFTVVADETIVEDVTGTTITVRDDLGFTPSAGYEIDLVGFPDEGAHYRYL